MKLILLAIGKTADTLMAEAINRYAKRLTHYVPFEMRILQDVKNARRLSQAQQKEHEGRLLLDAIDKSDFVTLLDEHGVEMRSIEFASWLDRKMSTLPHNLVFVIGGPYGFAQQVYDRADYKMSLSRFTLTHEMVRLFIVEQFYRAMTILRGEPYHHE